MNPIIQKDLTSKNFNKKDKDDNNEKTINKNYSSLVPQNKFHEDKK